METLEDVVLGGDRRSQVLRRGTDGFLEEGEEELVLATEVLVEAAQGLSRALHDFLDGELVVAVLDELARRVEKALDASFCPCAGRLERASHGLLAPAHVPYLTCSVRR